MSKVERMETIVSEAQPVYEIDQVEDNIQGYDEPTSIEALPNYKATSEHPCGTGLKNTPNVKRRQIFLNLIKEGLDAVGAMRMAGYSENTISSQRRRTLVGNITSDAIQTQHKRKSWVLSDMALNVADDLMHPLNTANIRKEGAKLALKNAQVFLQTDRTPPSITFKFTSINIGSNNK